jgi:hypothetical protein
MFSFSSLAPELQLILMKNMDSPNTLVALISASPDCLAMFLSDRTRVLDHIRWNLQDRQQLNDMAFRVALKAVRLRQMREKYDGCAVDEMEDRIEALMDDKGLIGCLGTYGPATPYPKDLPTLCALEDVVAEVDELIQLYMGMAWAAVAHALAKHSPDLGVPNQGFSAEAPLDVPAEAAPCERERHRLRMSFFLFEVVCQSNWYEQALLFSTNRVGRWRHLMEDLGLDERELIPGDHFRDYFRDYRLLDNERLARDCLRAIFYWVSFAHKSIYESIEFPDAPRSFQYHYQKTDHLITMTILGVRPLIQLLHMDKTQAREFTDAHFRLSAVHVPNPCAHEFRVDNCGRPSGCHSVLHCKGGLLEYEDSVTSILKNGVILYDNYPWSFSREMYDRRSAHCWHGQNLRLCDTLRLLVHALEGTTCSSPFHHTKSPVLLEEYRWTRIGPVREWVESASDEIECALFDPDERKDLTRVKETCETLVFVTNSTFVDPLRSPPVLPLGREHVLFFE